LNVWDGEERGGGVVSFGKKALVGNG